jgi:hypothetical protein
MLETPIFKDLIENLDKSNSMRLAHLISTRNLAPGGQSARLKALPKFRKTTETGLVINEDMLHKLDLVTNWIGGFVVHLKGSNELTGGHCSLNNSGTLDVPVSLGGRATDALIDLRLFLNEKPSEAYTKVYPWGSTFYPADRPRWQAWGRSEQSSDTEFLSPMEVEIISQRENLAGIGPYTGCMVYTVAYELYDKFKESDTPIPIRQATVSEPGGKVRIVTTGPWWLAVLQQPICHMLRELMAYHPSAYSVMLRADQAWQALKIFERLEIPEINEHDDIYVLSSDLEVATDAIPHQVGQSLVNSFIEGVGGEALKWKWITDLISTRTVFTEDRQVFTLRRGVMMGEPLSKVCLILLSLAVEELAYREYLGVSLRSETRPGTPWHAYHIGGDDHLAVGPLGYLKGITANHRSFGSIISQEKHRISKVLVVYTEKVLHFHGRILNMPVDKIDDNIDQSIFVDSMKIRLLSPFTKAMDTVNDRNVAIGKVKGIARTIAYLKDISLKRRILDRALYRFQDFIKGPHHRTIRAIESLPVVLGGLGIAIDTSYLANLPPIYNRALRSIGTAKPIGFQARVLLGSCFSNDTSRGVSTHDFIAKWINVMIENLMTRTPVVAGAIDWKTMSYPVIIDKPLVRPINQWFRVIDPQNRLTFRAKLHRLKEAGVVPLTDLPQLIERSYVFRRLLENTDIRPGYRTERISRRVAKVWTGLEELSGQLHADDSPLNERELDMVVKLAKQVLLINLNEVVQLATRSQDNSGNLGDLQIEKTTVRDMVYYGQPSMTVDIRQLTKD